jgi:hypothetical protein
MEASPDLEDAMRKARFKVKKAEPWLCLLCGKPVSQPVLLRGRGGANVVSHEFGQALHFYMPGNWGSGIWDPCSTSSTQTRLEGAICDVCLMPLLKRVRVVRFREEYHEVYSEPHPVWEKEQKRLHRERLKHERREKARRGRCRVKKSS